MENVDSAALITELCLVRDYVVVDGTFDHTRGFWVYRDRLWGGAPIGFVPPEEMARLSERGYVTVNAVGRAMLTAGGLKRISAADAGNVYPPPHVIDTAVLTAMSSPCRSKRGAVLFYVTTEHGRQAPKIVSTGFNYKPGLLRCDGSDACKSACRTTAVHAEQAALLGAASTRGYDMLHVKVGGVTSGPALVPTLVPSGPPSCVQCSKLMMHAGVAGVWLYHHGIGKPSADYWHRYSMDAFHELSVANEAKGGENG